MVITHLLTDTLPVLIIQSVISLLPMGRYLLPLTTLNIYTDGKTDRYCSKLILVASLSGTPSSSCETQLQAQADTTACHIQTKHVSVNM